MTIVETSVLIDLLRQTPTPEVDWLSRNRDGSDLALLDLSVCEILRGVLPGENFEGVRAALFGFEIRATGGAEWAEEAAQDYRTLRRNGITIRSTIDCLIATYCLRGNHFLLHNDRDFDAYEKQLGLRVLHV